MIAHAECFSKRSFLATERLRSASWVEDFTSFLVVFTTLYWLSKIIPKYFKTELQELECFFNFKY